MDVPAALFKAKCLRLMDQVEKTREPVIITKRGRPVAQLAPVPSESASLFGYMKNTVKIVDSVMLPASSEWSALSGGEDHLYERASTGSVRKK